MSPPATSSPDASATGDPSPTSGPSGSTLPAPTAEATTPRPEHRRRTSEQSNRTAAAADRQLVLGRPPGKIDALKTPTIRGKVLPRRKGVLIHLQVRSGGGSFVNKASTKTNAEGQYFFKLRAGRAYVKTLKIRTRHWVGSRNGWLTSGTHTVQRVRQLNPVVTSTSQAQVADTYHAGCPVGPSRLRTIWMNHWGFDKRMHRGMIIVRQDLTGEVIDSFRSALYRKNPYPIRKMKNPNVWNGDDKPMMAADNTSGFNCRKVTGNPYAQSPHSYGIALDVNTVRNPYRDANGTWWPKNGHAYIDRTPWKWGMLTKGSQLTRALENRGFFWGGRWYPGRDYQHFEYDR